MCYIRQREKIIEKQISLNDALYLGRTALHFVCYYNRNEIVEYLLQRNANTNVFISIEILKI